MEDLEQSKREVSFEMKELEEDPFFAYYYEDEEQWAISKRKKEFALFDAKRKKEENGPVAYYYMKEILSLYGIPDSQHLCMLVNWHELFPPSLQWDRNYCNNYIIFNPNDETDITFIGKGWKSSVLALQPNPTSFTIKIIQPNSLAIGIAPREGFKPDDPTMFACGCYMYTSNALFSGGIPNIMTSSSDEFPKTPVNDYVYSVDSILTCFYNREKGELSFTYNGVDFGVGYRNIPSDRDYYIAVSCVGVARVQLLDINIK